MATKTSGKFGFTIVELLVVIVVIGILAAIGIVSYGAWQNSIRQSAVKSDILAASSAMEAERGFKNAYPLSLPNSFTPNENVTITLSSVSTTTYCIDGVSTADATVTYYLDSRARDAGPQSGTCATRPNLTPPVAPASVLIGATTGTTATVSWPYVTDAASYIVQCASDAGFIYGPQQITVANTGLTTVSGVVKDLSPSTLFYCRVKAVNEKGASAWSGSINSVTDASYSALAVATSIEGYWSNGLAPQGFLLEDGSAVSRTTYADLFAVIGTTYGAGNGTSTFNLPDSRGRTTVHRNTTDAEFAAIGQITGSKTEQLTIAKMPSHTHIQNPHNHIAGFTGINGTASYGVGSVAAGNINSQNGTNTANHPYTSPTTATNQSTGSNQTHNNIQPSIVKLAVIKFTVPDSGASTLPSGSSISGYWSTAPTGYLLENGAAVSRTTYAELFAAIGTTYGAGNGSTTFNLPDSRGRASVNLLSTDAEFNVMGEKYGEKTHILTLAEMPSHTHTQNAHNHVEGFAGINANGTYGVATVGLGNITGQSGMDTNYHPYFSTVTAVNQSTGGGDDHNEIQPSIVKMSAIKFSPESNGSGKALSSGSSLQGYWATAPSGYLVEDGSAVSRATYADLFSAIGTTYGSGDGSTTFNLPNSRGRVGVNKSTDTEFNTMGKLSGSKTVTLTIAQLPSHTHTQNAHSHIDGFAGVNASATYGVATIGTPGNINSQNGQSGSYHAVTSSTTAVNQSEGDGDSHNNIQPTIVKMFVIKI